MKEINFYLDVQKEYEVDLKQKNGLQRIFRWINNLNNTTAFSMLIKS
jgi:hypothetical protein